ncbi:phosphoglycerate mutase family protein [Flavihumibacter sp. CACIAM 22H1]|uniref:SixA phosphatase family protein n=1 Tax=Flavihumibacter sp. CACIAM 22H1 TaxID=1812911 RepID=UPI000AB8FD24|nr:phosphoglycerate mutase family protein [Flavihumibacter sp. CACIAM 22H1]
MKQVLPVLILSVLLTACSQKYYIVRHAEKAQAAAGATMQTPGNPSLSPEGQQRAQALAERLKAKNISAVFSTKTIRTEQTAMPTAEQFGLTIKSYAKVDTVFIRQLKQVKGNTLIVGHSNTVDDLVNGLLGNNQLTDLPETAYDNLYILTKKGKRLTLVQSKYGQPSPH